VVKSYQLINYLPPGAPRVDRRNCLAGECRQRVGQRFRECSPGAALHFSRESARLIRAGQGVDRWRGCRVSSSVHVQGEGDGTDEEQQGGNVRVVNSRNFPVSKHIAAALAIVKARGMRELHWHPNASEWQFYIAGNARMTVFFPVDNARTMDLNANDAGYIPSNAPHYIENTGNTALVFLEISATDEFMDVSLNQWPRRVPSEMLKAPLNIDRETALKIAAEKLEVI
jgi:oxalate decarboxylase family bicupin protein